MIKTGFDYRVEPLAKYHDRTQFNCGVEALDHYLKHQARQDAKKHIAAPFVLVESISPKVVGFYTLSMNSVLLSDFPETVSSKLPRYPSIPSALLGRLAVDQAHLGKKLGQYLLINAMERVLKSEIATFCLIVEAKNDVAKQFYEHYGFIAFPQEKNKLFLPLKEIASYFKH